MLLQLHRKTVRVIDIESAGARPRPVAKKRGCAATSARASAPQQLSTRRAGPAEQEVTHIWG